MTLQEKCLLKTFFRILQRSWVNKAFATMFENPQKCRIWIFTPKVPKIITAILILARKFKHLGLLSCTMRDFWSICKYCDLRSKIFTEKIFEKVWTEKNWCCMEMNVKLGRKLRYAWIYVDTWFIIDVKWAAAASEQRATWTRYRGHGFEPSPSLEARIFEIEGSNPIRNIFLFIISRVEIP